MPLRVVHLSDLHFPSLDQTMWDAVKQATEKQNPHLLIVSGDLVDNPVLDDLRRVRLELDELKRRTGAALYVVAGNHDVFRSGLNTIAARSTAFEQIFPVSDQEVATPKAAAATPPAVSPPRGSRFGRLMASLRPYRPPESRPLLPISADLQMVRSRVCQPDGLPVPVLLALIDSNPNDAELAFAQGLVLPNELVALETALGQQQKPHLLRIAVIHHHVMPIAFSNGRLVGNESLMVLRNAADVLAMLARHRFDLVLHGHKHLSQFVRLDFSPADAEGYPIAVAAAGAAALTQERNKTNSCGFNFIEVADNGRIKVTSFSYGYGRAPLIDTQLGTANIDYRIYDEPMATVARRAFWRARQLHKTWCRHRICSFEVTENGDLLVDNALEGLHHAEPIPDTVTRRHVVGIPLHGRLAAGPLLDEASRGRRLVLSGGQQSGRQRPFLVEIPRDALAGETGCDYRLRHEVANSMTMTAWEDAERRRVDPPNDGRPERQEWVSVLVNYPVEILEIRLRLPSPFTTVQPAVRCERMASVAGYGIDPQTDMTLLAEGAAAVPDDALTAYAAQGLTWLAAERRWRLRLRRPMVGYRYELFWPLPVAQDSAAIRNDTRGWRDLLLAMADTEGEQSPQAGAAQQVFDELSRDLCTMLSGSVTDRRYVAALFVYDEKTLHLRPVVSRKSWEGTPVRRDFLIPLGDGLAGAAFQQCRTIAWANKPEQSPLVLPKEYPREPGEDDEHERAILAIPVFYDRTHQPPSPSNAIGVVAYSSWGELSKIPSMDDASASALVAAVAGFTQVQFDRIRESIRLGRVPPLAIPSFPG